MKRTRLHKTSPRPIPKLIRKLDIAVSKLVRAKYPVCQKCGTGKPTQCAHIFTRNKKATRFDPTNLLGLCYYCHLYWAHRSPLEFAEWVETKMGRMNFLKLRAKSQQTKQWTARELEQLIEVANDGDYERYAQGYTNI